MIEATASAVARPLISSAISPTIRSARSADRMDAARRTRRHSERSAADDDIRADARSAPCAVKSRMTPAAGSASRAHGGPQQARAAVSWACD
jgi:hypothetical protein